MLESEEKGYNSETITRQPFRLSRKWKKKFEPNVDLMDNHLINHNLINHNLSRISGDSKEVDGCSTAIIAKNLSESIGKTDEPFLNYLIKICFQTQEFGHLPFRL